MKVSKAQQAVLDDAKKKIDFARSVSFYDWVRNRYFSFKDNVTDAEITDLIEHDKKLFGYDYNAKRFEEEKNGITLAQCNSRTLYKLQEFGLIEIISDSKGSSYGIDVIKILNY